MENDTNDTIEKWTFRNIITKNLIHDAKLGISLHGVLSNSASPCAVIWHLVLKYSLFWKYVTKIAIAYSAVKRIKALESRLKSLI